jgi:hypothetical protein
VLLGDEPVLKTDVSYYQRLLAGDQDEATEIVEEYLETHPREALYDEVLVPALSSARRDREIKRLTEGEEQFVLRATREIVEHLPPPETGTVEEGGAEGPDESPAGRLQRITVLGLPARDEADELALAMLRQLLIPRACQIEILSHEMLSAEMVAAVEAKTARIVCVAALPPGGLTQSRYLCKRLRQGVPEVKILVGRWGLPRDDGDRAALLAAGADAVATRLTESSAQLLQFVPLARPAAGDVGESDGSRLVEAAGAEEAATATRPA